MSSRCDVGTCDEDAIVHIIRDVDTGFRGAKGCSEHAQRIADYCMKPVELWSQDYELTARFDHATREWVPIEPTTLAEIDRGIQ